MCLNCQSWFAPPWHVHWITSAPLVIDAPVTSRHWVLLVTWVGRTRYVPSASGPPPGAAVNVAV